MYEAPDGGIILPAEPVMGRKVAFGARHHFSGTFVAGEGAGQATEVASHTEMNFALVVTVRRDVVALEN